MVNANFGWQTVRLWRYMHFQTISLRVPTNAHVISRRSKFRFVPRNKLNHYITLVVRHLRDFNLVKDFACLLYSSYHAGCPLLVGRIAFTSQPMRLPVDVIEMNALRKVMFYPCCANTKTILHIFYY